MSAKAYSSFLFHCYTDPNYIDSDRWLKLSDVADRWTSHRALDDCFATLKVITDVCSEMGLLNELKETVESN